MFLNLAKNILVNIVFSDSASRDRFSFKHERHLYA